MIAVEIVPDVTAQLGSPMLSYLLIREVVMAFIQILEDGTRRIVHTATDYVKSLPTLKQWGLWLTTRPKHATVDPVLGEVFICIGCGQKISYKQAWGVDRTELYRNAVRPTHQIRIGAKVRMEDESFRMTAAGEKQLESRQRAIAVHAKGLGCPSCVEKFQAEERRVDHENAVNKQFDSIQATLATLKGCEVCGEQYADCRCPAVGGKSGFKPRTFRSHSLKVAWLNVFENTNCGTCKDTRHVWNKELQRYVKCEHCFTPEPGSRFVDTFADSAADAGPQADTRRGPGQVITHDFGTASQPVGEADTSEDFEEEGQIEPLDAA
jgi:hypothetical protein